MSAWTNLDTINKMLMSVDVPSPVVLNERVLLTLFDPSYLPNTNIDNESESVKVITEQLPTVDSHCPITLNGTTPVSLDHAKIVWNTVLVADSDALDTIYTENVDYVIDYFNGTIERTTVGSTIVSGSTVYIWYVPFTVLTSGNDYNINYTEGTITRRAGTSIPNKGTVYVDYSHSQLSVTDALIEEAASQAEALITSNLNPTYSAMSTDTGLRAGATQLALHIIMLSLAQRELRIASHSNSDDIAAQFISLSQTYLNIANQHLSPFIKQLFLTSGGVLENRFVTGRNRSMASPTVTATMRRK